MRCIIYELKLTTGKIINTQEGGGWNSVKSHYLLERGGKQNFSSEKSFQRFQNCAAFSALFMETFSIKTSGIKRYMKKVTLTSLP